MGYIDNWLKDTDFRTENRNGKVLSAKNAAQRGRNQSEARRTRNGRFPMTCGNGLKTPCEALGLLPEKQVVCSANGG
jgi:hypothetical protein